jgi:NADH:ubiquinone oxidoreductase subunit 6 (subunit J)
MVVIALAVTALVRQIFAPSGFFVVQQAALITLITGLVIALVIYVVAIVLTLRRVAAWQQIGAKKSSNAALWSLAITAFIALLPVLLAIVLPQNPAP